MKKYSALLPIIAIVVLAGIGLFVWKISSDMGSPMPTNSAMLNPGTDVPLVTKDIAYYGDAVGYFAKPEKEGSYPGVVMVHEWLGLNDGIKEMARNLAAEGYAVLAVDLYHGEVTANPTRARELTQSIDKADAVKNMSAAKAYLEAHGSAKIAALGWCFGGGQVMQFTLSGEPLDATVIYYGQLETDPEKLKVVEWPVLGIFGETDQSVKVESVRAFDAALTTAGVEHSVNIYPGVGHAFANPSGQSYAATEARDAWMKTLTFLNANLK